jgi:hypothetical protein
MKRAVATRSQWKNSLPGSARSTASVWRVCGQPGSSSIVIEAGPGDIARSTRTPGPEDCEGSDMVDLWNTIVSSFGGFDAITYAAMAIIMVSAAFMMPTMAAIVTATCGALVIFAFSVFLRALLAAKDPPLAARGDWDYVLALPLKTLLVYSLVFGMAIAAIHTLRMLSKQ